ncbi:Na(+)/H(+) antiporter subunit D [soil metagenome]
MGEVHPALVLLASALVLPLLPRRIGGYVAITAAVASGVAVAGLAEGTTWSLSTYGYELTVLRVDRLSLAFAAVFALATLLGCVFGLRTMGTLERVAALAYAGSAFGVVLAGDLMTLFFFWELKVATSVVVIWARRRAASSAAGLRYLMVHLAGGITLLAGIVWWLADGNGLAFETFELGGASSLILVGFLVSAAMPPLHAWLVDAYPEASVAGAVFLSAFTTKAAVYALARGFPGTEILIGLGVAMALYGVAFAMLQNDMRRLLSYHIVSQVGFMVAAVGLGTAEAINGATAHAFAHIIYKGLLLMGTGAVIYATGRRRLTDVGGLARAMPLVLVFYMVAALSISGVPLFSGFVSKELTLDAFYEDHVYWAYWGLKLASVGTFLSVGLKLPYLTWFNRRPEPAPAPVPEPGRRPPAVVRRLPTSMLVAMGAAAGINVAIGVFPGLLYGLMPAPVAYEPFELTHLVENLQFLAFVAIGFWLLRDRLGASRTITIDTDWAYRELPVAASVRGHAVAHAVGPTWHRIAGAATRSCALAGEQVRQRRPRLTSEIWMLLGLVLAAFTVALAASIVA